jgi:hypothetical protein
MMQCSGMVGAIYAKRFDMEKSNPNADAVDESVEPV